MDELGPSTLYALNDPPPHPAQFGLNASFAARKRNCRSTRFFAIIVCRPEYRLAEGKETGKF
ncbi:MAG TPA: hypothetical protein VGF01_09795 [Terracidiphilus sp.]|jgi:hypothetical protein